MDILLISAFLVSVLATCGAALLVECDSEDLELLNDCMDAVGTKMFVVALLSVFPGDFSVMRE